MFWKVLIDGDEKGMPNNQETIVLGINVAQQEQFFW